MERATMTDNIWERKNLVGGWTNPIEKYARQNGFIFPNFRGENKKYLSCHHLGIVWETMVS